MPKNVVSFIVLQIFPARLYRSDVRCRGGREGAAGGTGEPVGGARQHHLAALDVHCGAARSGFRRETECRTWRIWERLGFWISKPCLFGLAKEGLLSFFCNAMNISEFLHWFQSMFNFFPHICDWCPDIHSHGSDFVFWILLFHWFGTCICSFRLLARWMNRYVGPMHFILPAWIYVYYLMMLLILGKNFCKELSFLEIWATYEFVVTSAVCFQCYRACSEIRLDWWLVINYRTVGSTNLTYVDFWFVFICFRVKLSIWKQKYIHLLMLNLSVLLF